MGNKLKIFKESSFIVFTDLDLPQLIPVGETTSIAKGKGEKIVGCKLFSYQKIAVFTDKGYLSIYDLGNEQKLRLCHE
jgi:hypothetical protein